MHRTLATLCSILPCMQYMRLALFNQTQARACSSLKVHEDTSLPPGESARHHLQRATDVCANAPPVPRVRQAMVQAAAAGWAVQVSENDSGCHESASLVRSDTAGALRRPPWESAHSSASLARGSNGGIRSARLLRRDSNQRRELGRDAESASGTTAAAACARSTSARLEFIMCRRYCGALLLRGETGIG